MLTYIKNNIFNIIIIILLLIIISIITTILFLFISYKIYKFVKSYINRNNTLNLYNDYDQLSKKILNKYGNNIVHRIYVLYTPSTNTTMYIFNILSRIIHNKSFYGILDKIKQKGLPDKLYHASLIFELKVDKKYTKFIHINKELGVMVREKINIFNNGIMAIRPKHKKTLNNILNITMNKMGVDKYYNWDMFNNNCQNFNIEILKTIGIENKINNNKYQHPLQLKMLEDMLSLNSMSHYYFNITIKVYFILRKLLPNIINLFSIV